MKTATIASLILAACLIFSGANDALCCTVCHSKNPKMVKMHEQLGFKDCFNCHVPGQKKTPEELRSQMISDTRCINCHKK